MRVYNGFENLPAFKGAVVTVGSFDGLHRGHILLLERVITTAQESGGESVVLTFERHPRVVLGHADGLRLLSSIDEKSSMLESLGVDNLIVIPFDRDFSRLSPDQFVKEYLVERLNVETLVVGYNHHFGRGNEGGYDVVAALSREYGFSIIKVDKWCDEECDNVSSTSLRRMISEGDMQSAARLLSRPYAIVGQADGDGRVWVDDSLKLIPPMGEYDVTIAGECVVMTIDENGVVTTPKESRKVTIEVLGRR